jgi:NAD+ kinase
VTGSPRSCYKDDAMPHSFHSVALVGNAQDARVAECMLSLAGHLYTRGQRALVDPKVALEFPPDSVLRCPEQSFATRADLIIAIGGDGTLLYAARLVAGHHTVPLLGINRGRLGFLTDVSPQSMIKDVDTVLAGRYTEDLRSLLAARLERGNRPPIHALALNDVVVNKTETGRTLDFETSINGRFVTAHGGDGIVIATATGSTAYALSCGGPIVEPNLDAWVLAPICPHTLSDRPIVVRAGSKIQFRLLERPAARAQVTCDGTTIGDLEPGDHLYVESADAQITLLHPPGYDYYRLLRSKLHWGLGGMGGQDGDAE